MAEPKRVRVKVLRAFLGEDGDVVKPNEKGAPKVVEVSLRLARQLVQARKADYAEGAERATREPAERAVAAPGR